MGDQFQYGNSESIPIYLRGLVVAKSKKSAGRSLAIAKAVPLAVDVKGNARAL